MTKHIPVTLQTKYFIDQSKKIVIEANTPEEFEEQLQDKIDDFICEIIADLRHNLFDYIDDFCDVEWDDENESIDDKLTTYESNEKQLCIPFN